MVSEYRIGDRVEVVVAFVGTIYKEYWCTKRLLVIPDDEVRRGWCPDPPVCKTCKVCTVMGRCETASKGKECKECSGAIGRHATDLPVEQGTQAVVRSMVEDNGFGDDTVAIRLGDGTTTRARIECLR